MTTTTLPPIPAVEREMEPRDHATYDWRTGSYVMPRRYHLWLPVEQALAMDFDSATGFPNTGLPTPPIPAQYDLMSPAWGVPFTLWPVTRHVQYLGHDQCANWPDGQQHEHCHLTVTYEGHVCMYPPSGSATTTGGENLFNGVVASRFEQGTRSEQILVSYDLDSKGNRKSIGPNNEGTNRLIPTCRWLITQNLTDDDYGCMEDVIQGLIGKVNENGWADPVYDDTWLPAIWLYLGPQTTQNRDGTYTLVHQFDYDLHIAEEEAMVPANSTTGGGTLYAHQYAWYMLNEFKVQVNNIYKVRKQPVGPLQLSTLYLTADRAVGDGYLFADLFQPRS